MQRYQQIFEIDNKIDFDSFKGSPKIKFSHTIINNSIATLKPSSGDRSDDEIIEARNNLPIHQPGEAFVNEEKEEIVFQYPAFIHSCDVGGELRGA